MKKQWQSEIKLKIRVYDNSENDAQELIAKHAESIKNSSNNIVVVEVSNRCNMLDEYGNELPMYYNSKTHSFEYYVPLCPFGYTDCISDENYENSANIKHLRSFSGKPCDGCKDGSIYDNEDK